MIRFLVILLLFAAPLAAEYESNFGRVILAESDLIVQGVASAKRTRAGGALRVEVAVQEVIHGDTARSELSVYYTDREMLEEQQAVRALFALKELSDGGYSIVGKPVLTPEDDPEEDDKLRVARDFVNLEEEPADEKRTDRFWSTLNNHIRMGGYAAQNAAVELMFVARDRRGIVTVERFDDAVKARDAAVAVLTGQTRKDLKLAFQGLVEARVKDLKFRVVRRGDDNDEKRRAADELRKLMEDYPRAFTERDALLCDALVKAGKDDVLNGKLRGLAREIRAAERIREAEQKAKNKEARDRIKRANEG